MECYINIIYCLFIIQIYIHNTLEYKSCVYTVHLIGLFFRVILYYLYIVKKKKSFYCINLDLKKCL